MTEKRDWNAALNKKGLEASVSEEQARSMCLNQGSRYLFLVEAHAGPKTVNEDGSEKVNLIPDLVELIPAEQEDRVRTFMRALYMARPDQFGQQAFEVPLSDQEPTVDAAGAALDAQVEVDPEGEPSGIWSGDPDAPLTDGMVENPDYAPTTAPVADGPNENEPTPEATAPNVVSFTHAK